MTSRLTKAMQLAGVKVHRRRRNFKLVPKWEALLAPMSRKDRDDIHRFTGWCSVHGILPAEVTLETFEKYLAHLETETIQRKPRERWHVARRAWNRTLAGTSDPAFPMIPNNEPPGWRGMRWSDFPQSLQAEVETYKKEVTASKLFDEEQYRAIKAVTLTGYLNNLRWHLSRLVEDGIPASRFTTLAACIDVGLVKRSLELRLNGRELDETTRPALQAQMTALISVAKYLKVPEDHRRELKRIADKVRHRPVGMCHRNKERLGQFRDSEVQCCFFNLPFVVAKRLAGISRPTVRQAQDMQMAALLAILFQMPVRIKNAADLDLDIHISRPVGGKPGKWRISIDAHEVKNAVAVDAECDECTSTLLERYVSVFRPVILKCKPSSALFVSQGGLQKGSSPLSKQLSCFIKRELGLTVNAHLVRHLAAFVYLEAHPGDYETVRQFLGHKSIAVTIQYYAGADQKSALKRYDAVISSLRAAHPLKRDKACADKANESGTFKWELEDVL